MCIEVKRNKINFVHIVSTRNRSLLVLMSVWTGWPTFYGRKLSSWRITSSLSGTLMYHDFTDLRLLFVEFLGGGSTSIGFQSNIYPILGPRRPDSTLLFLHFQTQIFRMRQKPEPRLDILFHSILEQEVKYIKPLEGNCNSKWRHFVPPHGVNICSSFQ